MFTLDTVVPWGRSFNEYRQMFGLTDQDLLRVILGCADGPASFNTQTTLLGGDVVSADPPYQFTTDQIARRIAVTCDDVIEQTRLNAHEFVWTGDIHTPDDLKRVRMAAMRIFLEDYDAGKNEGRYVDASLPALPFNGGSFDLALCSHFLFLYSEQLGGEFHGAAIRELCRVAAECTHFPLLALGGQTSPFVEVCIAEARARGYDVTVQTVPYQFQRGGNQMLRIRRST